jgi:hypothetical protein
VLIRNDDFEGTLGNPHGHHASNILCRSGVGVITYPLAYVLTLLHDIDNPLE